MSEAELHVLRARLNGSIRNKAARGELRRGLPVGFVWGEADGEVRFHPDEAVVAAIRNVFASFAQTGSARRVWLWFRSEGLAFPLQMHQGARRGLFGDLVNGVVDWKTPTLCLASFATLDHATAISAFAVSLAAAVSPQS